MADTGQFQGLQPVVQTKVEYLFRFRKYPLVSKLTFRCLLLVQHIAYHDTKIKETAKRIS